MGPLDALGGVGEMAGGDSLIAPDATENGRLRAGKLVVLC